jgi:drug/metabolite transporter (DMT)-like permease
MKSLSPMGIALVERVMYGQQVAMGTYVAMLLIVASNAVSVLYDLEYHPAGYMWAMLNCAVNIAYVVMLRHYVKTDLSNGEKTLHNNVLLTAVSLSSAVLSGELPGFLLEFGATSARFKLLYAASCVLAVAIGTSVFWVLQATSGSTLSFVGASNKVFVVILGAVLFDVNISRAGWLGIVLGISASISFTVSKAQAAAGSYAPVDAAASHMSDVESDDEDSLDGRGGGDAGRGA